MSANLSNPRRVASSNVLGLTSFPAGVGLAPLPAVATGPTSGALVPVVGPLPRSSETGTLGSLVPATGAVGSVTSGAPFGAPKSNRACSINGPLLRNDSTLEIIRELRLAAPAYSSNFSRTNARCLGFVMSLPKISLLNFLLEGAIPSSLKSSSVMRRCSAAGFSSTTGS